MTKKFVKNKEDFTCENCGNSVVGDGYTNHCPKCLWSKHVDINPGDRLADCGGLMSPISVESKNGEERIVHECISCGYKKTNKVSESDNREELVNIAQNRDI